MTDDRVEPSFSPSGALRAAPADRSRSPAPMALVLLAAAIGVGGWYAWSHYAPATVVAASAPAPAASVAPPVQEEAAAPQAPTLVPATGDDAVKADGITAALIELLGRDAVLKFIAATDFPRRFVATVDNLGREQAPVAVWPVQPTPGRFTTTTAEGGATRIAASNEARYAPFVAFLASVDAAQAADLYRRMYPLLQQAYVDLGFANRPLNARVLEVIDLLLATPEPTQPLAVTLLEVKGPVADPRPWVRYEFQEPRYQRLAAGQKMLLRMGAENRKVVKARLQQLRQEILRVSTETARP